jgi:hypothetical protein
MRQLLLLTAAVFVLYGCDEAQPSVDRLQREAQEKTLSEANAQVGMPEIINFQEKRMMKTLYELRDTAIATHAYIVNSMQGCLVYLGPAIGYGMPYATQYSNPTVTKWNGQGAQSEHPAGRT